MKGKRSVAMVLLVLMMAMILPISRGTAAEKQRHQASFLDLFDTVTSITGFEESDELFTIRTKWIYSEMETYDHLYDIYEEYPDLVNLCTINRHPGETFTVDQKIIDLLLFAREVDEATGHRVNAMFGSVLKIWHEARENGINDPENAELPDQAALEAASAHTGFDLIEVDPEMMTVCLKDPEASIDVGALAKGYATQQVGEVLPEGYLLSVGGNVFATGPKADGTNWTIGVENPEETGEAFLEKLSLEEGAVVTSGDYQRYYEVDGTRYAHIIDPETLFPGTKWRSVTIIMDDSGWADALSTALFLMDQEEGQKLLEEFDAKALWIDAERNRWMSPGFAAYVKP